ncbi:tyrosine-type recombinase/integrase [Sulfurovum sp.]|uniref:tyrosine-type recombinase/integrase n=1 Tax=Sulfurovum sp. TaxID=1969726 RepID=UPI0025DB4224|nr:tyrosine-type recombinase/integrase [Sulfurovum sp.]
MTNKRINEVKSITKKRGQLTIEFFDNFGKIRQKDTGLIPTIANRQKLKRLIPEFEKDLREKQETREIKTLGQYADLYLELSQNHSQIVMKTGHVKRYLAYFDKDIYPKDIKLSQVKHFFANLRKRDGTPLVRSTKKHWRNTLKGIFQLAFEDGEIERNIISDWQLPKQDDPPSNVRPFTQEQVKKLLLLSKDTLHNYIGIGIHTGMRPEELVGLMINDIDFENGLIHVRRAITKLSTNTHTKTKSSIRKVPIFNDAIPYLKSQISFAREKRSLYLFCRKDGSTPRDIEDVTGHAKYVDKNGKLQHNDGPWHVLRKQVPGLERAKLHWTRHTFAVQMLKSKKFEPQEVAGMMGILLETLYNHYARYIDNSYTEIDRSISLYTA